MFGSLESGLGLDVVIWLQDHSNGLLDALAEVFHILGSGLFYTMFIPVFYWCWHKDLGRRLLIALLFSGVVVMAAKLSVEAPRPFQAYPDKVTPLFDQEGYGFPSGHVTNAIVMGGLLAAWIRQRWAWITFGTWVALMSWSRMAAGVHYPQDVVGGWLLGTAVLVIVWRGEQAAIRRWGDLSITARIGLVLISGSIFVAAFWPDDDGLVVAGAIIGAGLGIIWEQTRIRFTVEGTLQERLIRYAVGASVVLVIFGGLRVIFTDLDPAQVYRVVRYGFVVFVAMAFYPWIAIRAGLLTQQETT